MATTTIKWQLNAAIVNDGIFNATFPMNATINYTYVDMVPTLLALSRAFNRIPEYVQALGGHKIEFVVGLPSGYMHAQHPSACHPIMEFFGHPSGKHFASARDFIEHCVSLMGIGGYGLHNCACKLC
ncbi:hypothetical protein D6D01_06852 [Aureobasidium pullulans]|uniref:Cryptic loci regulator 2 N-terminal domain-containing protein n=1 Tax=Aureobasidium pullulans TaxID=5580 RepID=A0A4S9KUQ2_AURPU|nr:hypothetical protein D6D01_06852 [Aureobasidium pullulans]